MNRFTLVLAVFVGAGCSYLATNPYSNTPPDNRPVEMAPHEGCGRTDCGPPVEPARPPPAITGGNLSLMEDGTWVVADADRATLWHIGATSVLGKADLLPDDLPGRVLSHAGRAWVVLRRAAQLAELDLTTHVVTRRDTCVEPRGLAARGDEVLVGCAAGTIEAFSSTGSKRTLLQNEMLGDLRDLEVDGDRLLVSTFRNAQIFEVRDGLAPRVLSNPAKSAGVDGLHVVPRVAWRLRSGLMVAQDQLVDPPPTPVYYRASDDQAGIVTTALYRVQGQKVVPLSTSRAVLPVDVVSSAGGLLLVSAGTNELLRVDEASGVETGWPLPGQPTSVAASADTVAVFLREPARLLLFSPAGELRNTVDLQAPSVLSSSHQLFHRATNNSIACASCHPEAGEDGHTWHLQGVIRRTPSLRGGISSTAPFHWDGLEADLDALMADVLVRRMGGQYQSPERTAALARWLDGQAALRPPPVELAAAARGKQLFESNSVGCASCHSGVQGTNNDSVQVGTGGTFQVPRLLELAWRAPFFHDGRVESLEARFLPVAGGALHGNVDQLDAQQRADLLEYLRSR